MIDKTLHIFGDRAANAPQQPRFVKAAYDFAQLKGWAGQLEPLLQQITLALEPLATAQSADGALPMTAAPAARAQTLFGLIRDSRLADPGAPRLSGLVPGDRRDDGDRRARSVGDPLAGVEAPVGGEDTGPTPTETVLAALGALLQLLVGDLATGLGLIGTVASVAGNEAERLRLWQGRKKAFGAIARIDTQARPELIARTFEAVEGAPQALKDWGLSHRFAGSGDRAAIAGLVYDALRRRASSSIACKVRSRIGWSIFQ